MEVVQEDLIGPGLLDRVQLLPLDVLDEGDLSGAPAALSRNEAVPVGLLPDDDRLNDAVLPDGVHQALQLAEIDARLVAVWLNPLDVQQDQTRVGRLARFRDEAAQSFAE